MKKSALVLIVLVLSLQLLAPAALAEIDKQNGNNALNEEAGIVSGDYEYTVVSDTASEEFRGTVEIIGYHGNAKNVVIPAEIDGKKVTAIGDDLFRGNKKIETAVFPDTIMDIGVYVFRDCISLKRAEITSPVERFSDVFTGCAALEEVILPDGLEELGDKMFSGCVSLKSIEIPKSVKRIGDLAFEGCISLKEITIPEGAKKIGMGAFEGCTLLKEITIPDGVETIDSHAFNCCTSLESITLPSGITFLGSNLLDYTAYYDNDDNWTDNALYAGDYLISAKTDETVKEITVKPGTHLIAGGAFERATGLEKVVIPESVKKICKSAFGSCSALKEVELPVGLETIDDRTFEKSGIESIVIPEGVTKIGKRAFADCKDLRRITLPKSLVLIDYGAFEGSLNIIKAYYNGSEEDWASKSFGKNNVISTNNSFKVVFAEVNDDSNSDPSVDAQSGPDESSLSQPESFPESRPESSGDDGENKGLSAGVIAGIIAAAAVIIAVVIVCAVRAKKK